MYVRGYDLFDKRGGLTGFKPVESFKPDGLRRAVSQLKTWDYKPQMDTHDGLPPRAEKQ